MSEPTPEFQGHPATPGKTCPGNGTCCNRPEFDRAMFPCDLPTQLRAQLAAAERKRDEARAERNVAIGKRDDMRHNWEQAEQAVAELVAALAEALSYDQGIPGDVLNRLNALHAKYGAPQ